MLFKPKHTGARRLFEIVEFISLLANTLEQRFEVAEYVLEGYAFGAKSQAHKIGEGGAATKLALVMRYGGDEKVAFPTIVTPNAVKKFATGKGVGEKNQILLAAYRKWGVEFPDDNTCDAYILSRIGEAIQSGAKHNYEQEVVDALERNTEWSPLKR